MSDGNQSPTLSKDTISFRNNYHADELREKMYKYFKKETFCDIIIKPDLSPSDNEICAHRLVLSSQSEYFSNIFTSRTPLVNETEIMIENITGVLLRKIVEYCYTGRLEVENNKDHIKELLNKARYFQITFLEENCIEWLLNYSSLSPLGVYRHYSLEKYSAELREKLLGNICENFMQLCKSEEFLKLSADKLAKLIAEDNIKVESEENVLEALLAWLNYNFNERRQHIGKLLPLIRFPFLKPKSISSQLKAICRSSKNMKLMLEALEWHNVPENRATFDWICTKKRHFHSLIIIIGHNNSTNAAKGFEVYDSKLNRSVHYDIMPRERAHFEDIAATIMDDELIVAGGYDGNYISNKVYKLSLRSMTWSQLPSMVKTRRLFKLIVFQHKIYAVSGDSSDSSVECWDPTTNVWKLVSAMSMARYDPCVIELDNKLYALGGWDGSNLSSVECYDANLDKWTKRASMNVKRSDFSVGILNNFLYVISENSVERYDAKADTWILLHTFDDKFKLLKCISLHNCFIGTNKFKGSTKIVKYDPVTNEFKSLHKLKYNRWGHEVLAIPHMMLSKFQ